MFARAGCQARSARASAAAARRGCGRLGLPALVRGPGRLHEPLPGARLGRFHALQLGVGAQDGYLDREGCAGIVYGGPFARLSNLSPGQLFSVTTGQGIFRYRVLDVRQAGDPVPRFTASQGWLILATADGPAFAPSGVLRVDANLISKPQPAPAMVVSAAVIGPSELALGTDTLAWVPLVLWGQGLVLAAAGIGWIGSRWSRWQSWAVAVPVLGYLGLAVADQVTRLLPNVM